MRGAESHTFMPLGLSMGRIGSIYEWSLLVEEGSSRCCGHFGVPGWQSGNALASRSLRLIGA